jgi:hypothetical protein
MIKITIYLVPGNQLAGNFVFQQAANDIEGI